ncbi:MAG: glycosyltransferase family 2 protein, partial [Candidatus Brocadiae bacterium]|nr:glycosyltransferase family 2 protein [Candidatus Brocadiia bacterium]
GARRAVPSKFDCRHAGVRQHTSCCGERIVCRHPTRKGATVPARRCGPGCEFYEPRAVPPASSPRPPASPRISAVIIAFNEGAEVRRTVESLRASVGAVAKAAKVREPPLLEIVLVDDGSTDGSCDFAAGVKGVVLVRHKKPQGVGRARNAGWKAARGDVVTFHDAHMRFPAVVPQGGTMAGKPEGLPAEASAKEGGLETLARRALQDTCIVCAGSNGLKVEDGKDVLIGSRLFCCDLFTNRNDGFQPKWLHLAKTLPQEWTRSPAPMGAGYAMSRVTAEKLEAATGHLWDDIAGRWGFSEQVLAIKAFLMDIPIYFSRDVVFRHWYRCGKGERSKNPVPDAGRENWRNVCHGTATLFGRKVWEQRFKPWCRKWLGPEETRRISTEAFRAQDARKAGDRRLETVGARRAVPGARPWVRPVQEVFTHLCGKRAPITEPHPEHAWLPEIEAAVRRLRAGGTAKKQAVPAVSSLQSPACRLRVLQWRPGESTLLVRRLLPKAEVFCIEMPGHRAGNWHDICQANGIKLAQVKLTAGHGAPCPYASCPAKWRGDGFDLVLIAGEMQDRCKAAAQGLLRPGGRILVNPSADRMQIVDEELKKERKQTAGSRQQAAGSRGASRSAHGNGKPLVTVCLLNWQRPENIGRVLDSIAAQTVKAQVFLWNNGDPVQFSQNGGPQRPIVENPLVALEVQAGRNLGCFPRWWLASLAETDYVCSMDDDLTFKDKRVLEDAMAASGEECPDGIVGFFGWSQVEGKDYGRGRHHNGTHKGTRCDIIKGRFMLLRRALLAKVPLEIPLLAGIEGLSHREDDVYLSLCISGGRKDHHLVPARLGHRWKELSQGGSSASSESGHYQRRDRYITLIKEWLASRT